MPPLTQPDQLTRFFTRLGEHLARPAALYLFGGSALLWLGSPRTTVDVDIALAAPTADLRQAVAEAAAEMHLDVEESAPADFMPLPAGYERRHQRLGEFGPLTVWLFDPYSVAVMKIDRAFESDLEDVRFLLTAGHISLDRLAEMIEDVARRYDEPVRLRRQFEDFRQTL